MVTNNVSAYSPKQDVDTFQPAAHITSNLPNNDTVIFNVCFFSISIDKKRLTEHARMEMDELNIKCLQILRAIIHNEERKLPEDWQTRTSEHKIKKFVKLIILT